MMIYKILRPSEWAELDTNGESRGAPIDVADGFIHFSTAQQVAQTAALHFAGVEGLWLLGFEASQFGDALKWEPSRGGDLFPHLYGPLRRADAAWAVEMPLGPNGHILPDNLA